MYSEDGDLLYPGVPLQIQPAVKPNDNQETFKVLNTLSNGFGDDFEDGVFTDTWLDNTGAIYTPSIINTNPGEGSF